MYITKERNQVSTCKNILENPIYWYLYSYISNTLTTTLDWVLLYVFKGMQIYDKEKVKMIRMMDFLICFKV